MFVSFKTSSLFAFMKGGDGPLLGLFIRDILLYNHVISLVFYEKFYRFLMQLTFSIVLEYICGENCCE